MATKSLSKLKAEMTFNTDLTRLVDVMKGIDASQYFIMDRRKTRVEKFSSAIEEMFTIYEFRNVEHPFVFLKNPKRLIGVVATDSGFWGGLDMKVMQAAQKYETADAHCFVLGERGSNMMKEFGKT